MRIGSMTIRIHRNRNHPFRFLARRAGHLTVIELGPMYVAAIGTIRRPRDDEHTPESSGSHY